MRKLIFASALALAACASPVPVTSSALVSADAATSLAVGERVTQETSTQAPGGEGQDAAVNLTLRHADGRRLAFQEANHSPNDLFVQQSGGALAQIMGIGEDRPTLYHATSGESGASEGAFFCGPSGPAAIGAYEAPDGTLHVVGLRQNIQVEVRPDGQNEAVPFSPDQVCARLKFRRG
jgi:hypothetical protein